VQAALKEANENEELFELTVQGWLAVGRAYLSIQRSNDMFDKDQCKYAFDKVEIISFRIDLLYMLFRLLNLMNIYGKVMLI
jgi:hypothetical protein